MTFAHSLAAAVAAATLAVAPLAPAVAQQSDTAPEAQADVSDAKLDSFVVAALSVSEIAQDYEGRIQAAADDAARQSLADEAREAMIGAVEATQGITVEEYVTISEAARSDADLNQRVMDMLAERAEAE